MSYSVLLKRVRQAINRGKERALDAVERELVRTKWEVGKLVLEHILLNQKRAKYGDEVLKRLAKDIGTSITELKYMVEYARLNAKSPHAGFLSWDKQRDLLTINEGEKRAALAREAAQKNWSRETLRREIKKLKTAKQITVTEILADGLLIPKKGKLDTYKIILAKLGPWQGKPVIDLGFSNYLSLDVLSRRWPQEGAAAFNEGDIVISKPSKNGFTLHPSRFTLDDLFTYRVYLDEVTDADTLWVLVDLGFGFTTKQQLRLRGIDAPEITTREGQAAKRFVERQLSFPRKRESRDNRIIITSTKSDKYDRYLADVYYTVNGKEKFLNNELLKRKLATRVE